MKKAPLYIMEIKTTDRQAFCLKQYAALQFPGSIENACTKSPIHLLQQRSSSRMEISLNDAEEHGKEAKFGYCSCGDYNLYDSVEDIVKAHLEIESLSDNELEEFNAERVENGEEPFLTYQEAQDDIGLPVYDYQTYVDFYDICDDDITAFVPCEDAWDTMAVAFSAKELSHLEKELDNHIFEPTRKYAQSGTSFNRDSGDYYPIMDFLMKSGEALLIKDAENVGITTCNILSEEEIMFQLKNHPNEEFFAATVIFTERNEGSCASSMVVAVKMSGRMEEGLSRQYPVVKTSVVKMMDNQESVLFKYPFECDVMCAALREGPADGGLSNLQRLFFYVKYSEEIK